MLARQVRGRRRSSASPVREMRFEFKKLDIPDVVLINPRCFEDARGFFMETYRRAVFESAGLSPVFVQDNHARSAKGVLRGLHYQREPMAQGKLVRCIRGAIFDVAVDLRKGSPSYGKWLGRVLSDENRMMLWIPRGFAHGYLALEECSEVLYKTDHEYSPEHEGGVLWNDPDIGIQWPIRDPNLSEKDAKFPPLRESGHSFVYHKT